MDELEFEQDTKAVEEVQGDATSVPVEPGDKVVIKVTAEESKLLNEVRQIKAGEFKAEETEDIVDIIDNTLALQVPAVDGAKVTVEVPADAEAEVLDDVTLAVPEDTLADIITLVGNGVE